MKEGHLIDRAVTIWKLALVAFALGLILVGCAQAPDDDVRNLQAVLAGMLDDAAQCPAGTAADVEALIDAAGPDGVVQIPAGCYEIMGSIVIPQGQHVVGAGMDRTILYRDPAAARDQDKPIFWVLGRGENLTQVSGIAFLGVRDGNDRGEDYGVLFSNVRSFRLDHCYFEGFGWAGVRTEGTSRGVIDHSIFVDNFKKGIDNLGYGVVVYGNNQWPEDPGAGTAEAVFVEDCVFIGSRHAIAASGGAHYVFRYNRVWSNVVACSIDAHGPGFGWSRGTRYVEIYGNTIEYPVYKECGIGIRGGDGVIFDNSLRGFRQPILLILEWGTPERLKSSYPASDQIRDLWIWDNEIDGGPSAPQIEREARGFIEPGRDYYTQPKPGYEPHPYPHPLVVGR
ncbi:MAG: right-handed parallel beta-helix repeat-containing protein [Anaerolineae bacterium]|nr:right-handed parallel beta-helix repeat-containing protein [Anaerolineae bacterium]